MLHSIPLQILSILNILILAVLFPEAAAAIVVPGSLEFTEGGSGNCIPLSGCTDRDRYQQVFDSSEFGGVIWISEIRFRRDLVTAGPVSTSFSNVSIALSTTPASVDGLSTTFASNQGADYTVVHSGALTISSASSGGSPAPFDVSVVLDQPFRYDPSQGNLLLDWTNWGGETFSGFYDASPDGADSVSRIWAVAAGALTGSTDSIGLVAQFVPLPATVVLPNSLEFTEGGSGNCIPLSGCADRDRYQQVFGSSEFDGPIRITELRFRRNLGTTGPLSTSFSNVTIALSTTSASVDGLSTTFASNQGADYTLVHFGPLTISSASSGGSPAPFDVSIALYQPFRYDPSQGNLLLDWTNWGGETFSGFYDASPDGADSVSRIWAVAAGALTGSTDSTGLVAQFRGAPLAPVFSESFEGGLGGFMIDNTIGAGNGLWHMTTACNAPLPGHSLVTSLYYGQDATCDYENGVSNAGMITSPAIAVLDTAWLSFNYFLETEGWLGGADFATVLVSVNGGLFQIVASNDPGAGVDVLPDPSGAWVNATVDLSSFLPPGASTIQIRFQFDTVDAIANTLAGFYFDDITVSTFPYYFVEDFETGVGAFVIDNAVGVGNGLWHPTTVCDSTLPGHSFAGSLYYGLDISCDYDFAGLPNEGIATSPPIFVQGGAALEFNYFLATEQSVPFYDAAEVLVSVDAGPLQLVGSNDPLAGAGVLLDSTGAWEKLSVDLGPLLPPSPNTATVEVFFSFETGDGVGNNYPGFYVDDLTIHLPEPRMALQLGTGLVALAGLAWRRRRRSAHEGHT